MIPSPVQNTTACVQRKVEGCLEFAANNSNNCSKCHPLFYLQDLTCKKYLKKCKKYNLTKDQCESCYSNMYLTDSGECLPYSVWNCLKFQLNQNKCALCKEYVEYLDPTTSECIRYNLENCKTPETDKNECKDCKDGYYHEGKTKCLKSNIIGCSSPIQNSNTCSTCMKGFYLDSNTSQCLPQTIPGCKIEGLSITAAVCSECESGFYLDNDRCYQYTVTDCSSKEQNKDECKSNGCNPRYKFNSGKCQVITIPHCTSLNNLFKCDSCEKGFYLDDDICLIQFQEGCKTYMNTSVNQCSICKTGYIKEKISSTCTKKELPWCLSVNQSTGDCDTCKEGFYWDVPTSKCLIKDTIGCSEYDSSGKCISVYSLYYKLENDIVTQISPANCYLADVATNTCNLCMGTYHKDNNGVCQPNNLPNCLQYELNGDCLKCENLYYIFQEKCKKISASKCIYSDGKLEPCTLCQPGHYVNQNDCTFVRNPSGNCKGNSLTSISSCSDCFSGYVSVIIPRITLKLPNGCTSVEVNGNCLQVKEGWEVSAGKRRPIQDKDSKCIKLKPIQSDLIDADTKCAKCRFVEKYYLLNGTCTIREVSKGLCSVYNTLLDECVACKQGLAYAQGSSNVCTEDGDSAFTSNCLATKYGKGCYQCKSTYVSDLSDSNKCKLNPAGVSENCRDFSGSECTTCLDGYIKNDSNVCLKDESCWRLNNGKCSVCWEDYKITADPYRCVHKKNPDTCKFIKVIYAPGFYYGFCSRCKNESHYAFNGARTNGDFNQPHRCYPATQGLENFAVYQKEEFKSAYFINETVFELEDTYLSETGLIGNSNFVSEDRYCLNVKTENCDLANSFDFSSACIKCKEGFYTQNFLGDIKCVRGGLWGCKYYSNKTKCDQCFQGYKKEGSICVQIDRIPYCKFYKPNEEECVKCKSGYIIQNKECRKSNRPNCVNFQFDSNLCFACQQGYFVEEFKCKPYTVNNCLRYVRNRNFCSTCQDGYYLSNGDCFTNTSLNCLIKSIISNVCLACTHNYYFDIVNSLCLPLTDINCRVYNPQSNRCLMCDPGYFLKSEGICLRYTIQNCQLKHSDYDRCLTCDLGYFLNSFGQCSSHSLSNCLRLDPFNNRCIDCKPGFYRLANGICRGYSIVNCMLFNPSRDACMSCLPSYYKTPNATCKRYSNIANCSSIDPNRDQCLDCLPGHFLDLGQCSRYTVSYCTLFMPGFDICFSCDEDHFLMDNQCIPYSSQCKQYSINSNDCESCDKGFFLKEGRCHVNTASFCSEFSQHKDGCSACHADFYLEDDRCVPRSKSKNCREVARTSDQCISCFKTHYIAGGFCISYGKATCKTFDDNKDICLACEEGKFWMSHGVCEEYSVTNCKEYMLWADKCKICEEGLHYLGSNGNCHHATPVDKCFKYSNIKNECIQCSDGFYLFSANECRTNPDGIFKCIEYTNNETCSKCELGFYLENNFCERSTITVNSCFNYSGNGVCAECISGFMLSTNPSTVSTDSGQSSTTMVCSMKTENSCLTWTDPSSCATCHGRSVLVSNSKGKQICEDSGLEACLEASMVSGNKVCTKCSTGFFVSNQTCKGVAALVSNCDEYEADGICKRCISDKTLSASRNTCLDTHNLKSDNCDIGVESTDTVCRLCQPGFELNNASDCLKCGGDGCNVCHPSDSKLCLLCQSGYDHNGLSCSKEGEVANSTASKMARLNGINFMKPVFGIWMLLVGTLFAFY